MVSVFHQTFSDPYAYERSMRNARVTGFAVSERGAFNAEHTLIDLDGIWLQMACDSLARSMHISIDGERQRLLFFTDSQVPPALQSGAEFNANDLVSLGRTSDHFQRTLGPSRWSAMALPPDRMHAAIRLFADRDIGDSSTTCWLKPSTNDLSRLRQIYREIIRIAHHHDGTLDHPELMRSLTQSLTVAVGACFATGNDRTLGLGWHRHTRIMKRFADWLEANIDRALYLPEVCAALDVPARTLNRCCEEHLGMSPRRHLWLRRMNLARQELQRKSAPTSVTAIATQFGFWHLGRFAVEYGSLFGEAPSTTLARS